MAEQSHEAVLGDRGSSSAVRQTKLSRTGAGGPALMLNHLKYHWHLAVAVFAVSLALLSAWQVGSASSSTNEATAVVLFRQSATTDAVEGRLGTNEVERELGAHAAMAGGDDVRRQVEEATSLDLDRSSVSIDSTVDGLLFVGVSNNAEEAAAIANAWAVAYLERAGTDRQANLESSRLEFEDTFGVLRDERIEMIGPLRELQQQLDSTIDPDRRTELIRDIDARADLINPDLDRIDSELRSIGSDLAAVELAQLNNDNPLELARQATAPESKSLIDLRSWLAVATAGLGLGVLAALLRGHFDKQIRSAEQLEEMGLAVLATIPAASKQDAANPGPLLYSLEDGEAARQYHLARTALGVRQHPDRRTRSARLSVAVVSAAPGEGRTTVAGNITKALVQAGEKAAIIAGDPKSSEVHLQLGLNGDASADLTSGLSVVIYDTSPLSNGGGALDIASVTDWTVLVTRRGRALQDVGRATSLVERAGGRVLGVVYIDAPMSSRTLATRTEQSQESTEDDSVLEMGNHAHLDQKVTFTLESRSE